MWFTIGVIIFQIVLIVAAGWAGYRYGLTVQTKAKEVLDAVEKKL